MNYVILDLEWNQCPYGKDREDPRLPFEILEIGAIRCNDQLMVLDTFNETIKPSVYHQLHYRTREIIGQRWKEFLKSRTFPEVAADFISWCGEEFVFCTWGPSDLPELQRNLDYYDMPRSFPRPLFYYDIQKLFSLNYEDGKLRRSLEWVVEYLKIEKDIPFHQAFDDTYYTSLVMKHLDWKQYASYQSVDYYRPPLTRKEEIHMHFRDYSKFVSHVFPDREPLLADRTVTQTRCYICGRLLRKQISWFPTSQKQYACVIECPSHGLQKGKLRIKKGPEGTCFAIRTIKSATTEQIDVLKARSKSFRQKNKKKPGSTHLKEKEKV